MSKTDDELLGSLTDGANPRTPLHFKLLDHQRASAAPFLVASTTCDFHRTEGWVCGVRAGATKPISKLFPEDDADGE